MLLTDKQIFIVEDNLQNRVVFQVALMRYGATIEFERWGQDAIQRLQRMFRVDLIILDLMLAGGISGFDIFDEIRTLPAFARVPIVAVSAMDPAVAVPQVRTKGFSGFIAKPVDTNLLPTQIASIIGGKQIWYTGAGAAT